MKLAVIIVNYKVRFHLEQCLDSVFRAMKDIDGEVYVVDNASGDDSVSYLRARYPQVIYVENDVNVGFAKANNMALSMTSAEYVLLLNPDTIVGEDVLKGCVDCLDNDPQVGACGVKMLNLDGTFAKESRRGVPTPTTAFFHMSGLSKLFPRNRVIGKYHMMFLDKDKYSEIEIISGAFMFIRRSLLDEVGFFDESFFMYGEDIDLSYRLLLTGHKNYYLPLRILHYKGESTRKDTYRYVKIFYQAMLIFFSKYYSNRGWFLSIIVRMAIWGKGAAEFIRRKLRRLFVREVSDVAYLKKMKFFLDVADVNLPAVKAFCEKNHLNCDVDSAKDADCVIYDVDSYSYSEVLSKMESLSCGTHAPCAAIYSPKFDNIIVGSVILR